MSEEIYTIDYIINNQIHKKAYGFIYITTNLINNKKYIGQKKFNDKWINYLGSGIVFKKALEKYKKQNFKRDIIFIADNAEELNSMEISTINKHQANVKAMYYNIALGGNGNTGQKGHLNYYYGKGFLFKGKLNPFYGKHHSERTKLIISAIHKGNKYWLGKHHSNSSKEKNRLAHLGRTTSEKHKQIMKNKWIGSNNPRAKGIVCLNTSEVFKTITEAENKYHISNSGNISACCKGKRNYCGKHPETGEPLKWLYYEDYIKQQEQIHKENTYNQAS